MRDGCSRARDTTNGLEACFCSLVDRAGLGVLPIQVDKVADSSDQRFSDIVKQDSIGDRPEAVWLNAFQ